MTLVPSNVICGEQYTDSFVERAPYCSWAFWQNGPVEQVTSIKGVATSQIVNGKGLVANIPYWNALAPTNAMIPTLDSSGTDCDCIGTNQGQMTTYIEFANLCWAWEDMAQQCLSANEADPASVLYSMTDDVWRQYYSDLTAGKLAGIMADDLAGAAEFHHDQSTAADPSLSYGSLLQVLKQFGCQLGDLEGVIVHENALTDLLDERHTNPMMIAPRSSETGSRYAGTFYGLNVICSCHPSLDNGDGTYNAIFYGKGLLSYAPGRVAVPEEFDRDTCANNGGGMTKLMQRQAFILHPYGFDANIEAWRTNAQGTGNFAYNPNATEYAAGGFYTRQMNRKDIPLGFMKYKPYI